MDEREHHDHDRWSNHLSEMNDTRQFLSPQNLDPSPDLEYCHVSRRHGDERYQVNYFDGSGLQSSNSGLSKSEVQAMIDEGGWELIAQELTQHAHEGAVITRQYSRPKAQTD